LREFKAGDRVRIVRECQSDLYTDNNGLEGEYVYGHEDREYPHEVRLDLDTGGTQIFYEVELVEEKELSEFRLGDIIEIVRDNLDNKYTGHVGTITELSLGSKSGAQYAVDIAAYTGRLWCYEVKAHNVLGAHNTLRGVPPKAITPMTQGEYIGFMQKTFKEMEELIIAKNSDYSEGVDAFKNFRKSLDVGVDPLVGLRIRVGDKIQRIDAYIKRGDLKVISESVEDSWRDLIGYSMIAIGMLEEKRRNNEPVKEGQ
jgi:hypothetical protein